MTQKNLGDAFELLGERESGTENLEEALAAYRGTLEERTRERVPLQWAYSQHRLANVLAQSGDAPEERRPDGRSAYVHTKRDRGLSTGHGTLLAADSPAPRHRD